MIEDENERFLEEVGSYKVDLRLGILEGPSAKLAVSLGGA
jgi:hypothetical protein